MAFPHNSLVLQHAASGFGLCFDAVRTLRSVDGVQESNRLYGVDCRDGASKGAKGGSSVIGAKPKAKGIKVAYAKEWGKSRNEFTDQAGEGSGSSHFGAGVAKDTVAEAKDYDWTYSTTWAGSIGSTSPQPLLPTQSVPTLTPNLRPLSDPSDQGKREWFQAGTDPSRDRIPVERLGPSSGEPILFYDDIVLYEDELADNGSSIVNVKVRVMPSGFLVLQRFFLRVDDVLFRVFDTRLYCQFDPSPVPRPLGTSHSAQQARTLSTSLDQLSLGAPRTAARQTNNDAVTSSEEEEGEESILPRLIRECSGSEAPYSLVRSHLPPYKPHDLSPLTDINWVSATLTKISHFRASSYHANVAKGTQLPRLADVDASAGAKFLPAVGATARMTGFPGTRPGERIDLSPAQAPTRTPEAQILGQIDTPGESREEWQGSGARVDVAVLRPM